eukprot:9583058-Alexandrium_andersonii.AAC.1
MGDCFVAEDGSDTSLAVLALKGRGSRAILARPALRKGRSREDAVGRAVSSARRLGRCRKVLLKTDDGPALVDLRAGVAERLRPQVASAPPVLEPQPDGS